MSKFPNSRSRPGFRKRLLAVAAAAAVGAGVVTSVTSSAGATEQSISNATIEWSISAELQSATPFGGCSYLSAGQSDGTQTSYQTTKANVAILKSGAAPTWSNKCDGASTGAVGQKVRWSSGTGTVDTTTGAATLSFVGELSLNFYGGLVPFTIKDPVLTVSPGGDGQIVATVFGYESSMDNPNEKEALAPVSGVRISDLSGVAVGAGGFTVTPDYEGVPYEPPAGSGGSPQNRTTPGWGAWPASFIDYHYLTGLTSYWYHSGGAADPKKSPSAITVTYSADGSGPGVPQPGPGEQVITAEVPEFGEPGEFIWAIDGDGAVDLGSVVDRGGYLQATGAIDPISITDTRSGGPQWSVSGQIGDFNGGISGKHLGWSPKVLTPGAGAIAGTDVASGISGGDGLTVPSILAAGPSGHDLGSALVGADLDLRLPVETAPGTYSATLTITALS